MQTEPTRTNTTTTTSEPGLFETIIKYDHPTSMGTAFNDHMMESDAAGIDRHGRRMTICAHNADRTEWHLRTEPNAPDPADYFPCCAPGGKGH